MNVARGLRSEVFIGVGELFSFEVSVGGLVWC